MEQAEELAQARADAAAAKLRSARLGDRARRTTGEGTPGWLRGDSADGQEAE